MTSATPNHRPSGSRFRPPWHSAFAHCGRGIPVSQFRPRSCSSSSPEPVVPGSAVWPLVRGVPLPIRPTDPFPVGSHVSQGIGRSLSNRLPFPLDHTGHNIQDWSTAGCCGVGVVALRHRRRIPPGHCQQCGYDLTGNESGVCPECGRPVV